MRLNTMNACTSSSDFNPPNLGPVLVRFLAMEVIYRHMGEDSRCVVRSIWITVLTLPLWMTWRTKTPLTRRKLLLRQCDGSQGLFSLPWQKVIGLGWPLHRYILTLRVYNYHGTSPS